MSALATTARAYEHMFMLYKRTWRGSLFNSFLSPVLFLLAMGIGLGTFIDDQGAAALGVPYIQFLAPGLLASTVMQTAAFESTFPVIGGMVWIKRYHAMYATPLRPADIALGQLGWIATRLGIVATIFVVVIVLFGAARSPLVVLAIPVAVLTGMAFSAPIAAFAATQDEMAKFNAVFRFGITPLFLFSGTFFPIEQLPAFVQPLAWITPLWHGVDLARSLSLGTVGQAPLLALVHLLVLLAFVVGGVAAAVWAFRRRLVK
jgi:lipooligosaccharide transport system permease protein